jgi:iron(III) transport system ATP-binding protein
VVAVRVEGLVKRYATTRVVDEVSFSADDGEFVTLLGPSGCGKTTTLRCIAGLERPDEGSIAIGETTVFGPGVFVPIHKRHIGMVFQSYAVWPHMTVAANVGFPLRLRRVPTREARERVQQALELVDLAALGERYPYQLSGGQQQRVALARALVYNPRVLLLDEPLSNLDAKLREQMRGELRAVQRRIGVTTVYVTHDQAEAMELSDRIVVMNRGKVEQVGGAIDIYRHPASAFVRTFVGLVNQFPGVVGQAETDGPAEVTCAVGSLQVVTAMGDAQLGAGEQVGLWIRPEDVRVSRAFPPGSANVLPARVARVVFQGSWIEYWLRLGTTDMRVVSASGELFQEGEEVRCQLPIERLRLAATSHPEL